MIQCWHHTQLYPAFRQAAQIYRLLLRMKAALGFSSGWRNADAANMWLLGEFVDDVLPNVSSVVVLLGTPGPAQKITVQLWNRKCVVGYFKYAENPAARVRLMQEHKVLSALPDGLGPKLLKCGKFLEGLALVTEPLEGKPLPTKLPPVPKIHQFLNSLATPASLTVDCHPWIRELRRSQGTVVDPWVTSLTSRKWSVVVSHGDFAPWNILNIGGQLKAIDWEYGQIEGFPYLDLTYYLLQVAALIYRWSPEKAMEYAISHLNQELKWDEAMAIVKLTAFYAYQQSQADGHAATAPLQEWRCAIWQSRS
jgi:hypothetical protein